MTWIPSAASALIGTHVKRGVLLTDPASPWLGPVEAVDSGHWCRPWQCQCLRVARFLHVTLYFLVLGQPVFKEGHQTTNGLCELLSANSVIQQVEAIW